MCVYLYMHNKYTQSTNIYYTNKNLIAINRLTALIYIYNFCKTVTVSTKILHSTADFNIDNNKKYFLSIKSAY